MITHWDFVATHSLVAILFVMFGVLLMQVFRLGAISVAIFVVINTAIWFMREAWDHEWDFAILFSNPQAFAEWLSPVMTFAILMPVAAILLSRK